MKAMLASEINPALLPTFAEGDDWVFEPKYDGIRILAHLNDGHIRLLNREGVPSTKVSAAQKHAFAFMQELAGEWVVDGEWVAGDEMYYIFDLPMVNGVSGLNTPLRVRRTVLEALESKAKINGGCRIAEQWSGLPATKLEFAGHLLQAGHEGVMVKHLDSLYQPGTRSTAWLKAKFTSTVDAIVTGIHIGGKNNCAFSVFDNGKLVEIGKCSLNGKPTVAIGDVVEVKYLCFSGERVIQPRMLYRRDDKTPRSCTLDQLTTYDRSFMQ